MIGSLGKNIRKARKLKRLNQREAAELMNLAPSTWSLYESGNREPPVTTLRTICETLDVSADYLLGLSEEMKLKKEEKEKC